MIRNIQSEITNVSVFEFTDIIEKEDFETTVFPEIEKLKDTQDEINMVYILNTELKQFTAGAWLQDALLGLKNFTNFNRVAIVSSSEGINGFTDLFSKVIPGEFRGFEMTDKNKAIDWAAKGE